MKYIYLVLLVVLPLSYIVLYGTKNALRIRRKKIPFRSFFIPISMKKKNTFDLCKTPVQNIFIMIFCFARDKSESFKGILWYLNWFLKGLE